MTSPINYADDRDFDDAALWAVIDSAAAAASISSAAKSRKPLALKNSGPVPKPNPSPHVKLPKQSRNHQNYADGGEVLQNHRPNKIARSDTTPCSSELINASSPPLALVKHVQRTPITPVYNSPDLRRLPVNEYSNCNNSPIGSDCSPVSYGPCGDMQRHSLSGRFPTVSLFKEYQNAAMAILEKSDYTVISGSPYIKKSGWRKISFYFNVSYEIRDKTIEFDDRRNVVRAEFVVRAHMQGGRFSDGWGSCECREKRFQKPNHDIPSTAETRAKNKACQDLLGIGEYRPGASHVQK